MSQKNARFAAHQKMHSNHGNISNRGQKLSVRTGWQVLHMHNRADKPTNNGHAILIVEDHDKLREALAEWLRSFFSDYTFLVAGSAEKAIELAEIHHPAIVIMDLQLPRMNGIEAIRHIKKISPKTQAVVLTVMKDSAYIDVAMAAGACAFINKQNMHAELIPALTRLLSPQTTEGEEA